MANDSLVEVGQGAHGPVFVSPERVLMVVPTVNHIGKPLTLVYLQNGAKSDTVVELRGDDDTTRAVAYRINQALKEGR